MSWRHYLMVPLLAFALSGCSLFDSDEEPEDAPVEASSEAEEKGADPLAPEGGPIPPAPEPKEPEPKRKESVQPEPLTELGPVEGPPVPPSQSKELEPFVMTPPPAAPKADAQPGPKAAPAPAGPEPDSGLTPWSPEAGDWPAPLPGPQLAAAERKVDLVVTQGEAADVLRMIAELVGIELELSPLVRGEVSIELKDEPWRRALERVAAQLGEFEVRGRGDLVRIAPRSVHVLGDVTAVEADRVKVRLDGKQEEVEVWLPAEGESAREELSEWVKGVRPGSRVALVCNTLSGRLVARAAAAVR